MKKFAIVAQSPKSERNIKEPVVGTRSYTILSRWLKLAGIDEREIAFFNATDDLGPISKAKVVNDAIGDKTLVSKLSGFKYVVSLGNIAQVAVRASKTYYPSEMVMTHGSHFNIPHPSGLNRKLNNPEEHEMAILTLMTVKELSEMEDL
jgi:hypothetical protein